MNAVSDGFIALGDSAFHTNPLNGYEIGPAMISAKIASETAIFCLKQGRYSRNDLLKFNYEYMMKLGKRYTINKIIKDFIQTLDPTETEYFFYSLGIKNNYTSSNFIKELSNQDKIKLFLRLSKRRNLPNKIIKLIFKIKLVSAHLDKYPKKFFEI